MQETITLTDDQIIVLNRMGFETAQALLDNHLAGGVKELREEKGMNLLEATEAAPADVVAAVADDLNVDPETFEPVPVAEIVDPITPVDEKTL